MGNSTVEADSEQALAQLPMPTFPQIITPSNVARLVPADEKVEWYVPLFFPSIIIWTRRTNFGNLHIFQWV